MLTLTFDQIYSLFLSKLKALDLIELVDSDAFELMGEWLLSVKAHPRVRKLFSSINFNFDTQICNFTLKNPIDDETDCDFIRDLFAVGMTWKWAEPKYFSAENVLQFFGGKEEKFYSQSNHMNSIRLLYEKGEENLFKTIRDYGYINNSYLNG